MRYNTAKYNDQRYNIDGIVYATSLSETVTNTDGTQLAESVKVLMDALSSTDATIIMSINVGFGDFMFMDEMIQIQFTNKALTDTLRLADWFSIERSPARNEWYD